MGLLSPFVPYHNSAGQTEIKKFGGLLTTEFLPPLPGRSFRLRQTYRRDIEGPIPANLRNLIDSPRRPKGPPVHFHQFQTEYFTVEHGICAVEIDGAVRKLTHEDGETSVKAGHIHAFWIDDATPDYMTVILSASDPGMDYQLDRVFFENWYGYWSDALLHDGGLDWIQTLCTHDAGDHYTPAPAWMPFRRFFGYWTCVVVGRWIGGLLGYKPFFREYTTDWDFAVAKMKGQPLLRRLIHNSYTARTPWFKQVELSQGPKPTNAEYEEWVVDIAERRSGDNRIATAGVDVEKPAMEREESKGVNGVKTEESKGVNGVKTDESKGVNGVVNGTNGYTNGVHFAGDITRRKRQVQDSM